MTVFCWEDGPWDGADDAHISDGSTCVLPDGHDGPHVFTPDSEITISFAALNQPEEGE